MSGEDNNIKFMNVDLDIESREPIDMIIKDFGENAYVLHHDKGDSRHFASFEVSSGAGGDAESIINYFCTLIYSLSDDAQKQWDACVKKNFDIGYESGEGKKCFQSILHQDTIKDVADLGGAIVITIYPVYKQPKQVPPADPPG